MNDLIQESAQVMKKCQAGTNNYGKANNLHAECYGTIGALLQELERMRTELEEAKSAIHYPGCWDTMSYPKLKDALNEIGCNACDCIKDATNHTCKGCGGKGWQASCAQCIPY